MAAQDILRIMVFVLSAASIAVMVSNKQTVYVFSIRFDAHFYYSSSLRFFVAANGIICGYSLLELIINIWALLVQRVSQRKGYHHDFSLFVFDLGMTLLLISGCAAATAIGYVGQYGEEHVGWLPICDRVSKFCKTNLASILLSYLALVSNLGLTLLMTYKSIKSSPKNESA
ncbi:hypothetical protein RIF29_05042 [Crotalaria pallida]|uniref:CASP-like protein n=1 Tax=Crotalaria pallida TaxID=3830 RepID=A0AAN9J1T7_CROPI